MLFGRNPELTELAHRLSTEITHMPTCAVAEFTFNAKYWSNIGKARIAKVALDSEEIVGQSIASGISMMRIFGAYGRGARECVGEASDAPGCPDVQALVLMPEVLDTWMKEPLSKRQRVRFPPRVTSHQSRKTTHAVIRLCSL
jgi:hypothetical protein